MVKIINNRGQYKITIPKDVIISKGWNEYTKLRFVEDVEGNIILKEIAQPSHRDQGNQEDTTSGRMEKRGDVDE